MFLTVKQLAWQARDSAGEGALLVSRGLTAGKVAPDAQRTYDRHIDGSNAAWRAIDELAATTPFSPALTAAMARAKELYLAPDVVARRDKTLASLIAGEKPEFTANEWSRYIVPKLNAVLGIAEAALDEARQRAEAMHSGAVWALTANLLLVAAVVAGSVAMILMIDRRVIHPLHRIRDVMGLMAGGEAADTANLPDRPAEIGALVATLHVFEQQAAEKARLEAAERDRHAASDARRQAIDEQIRGFEEKARTALSALTGAAARMRDASGAMDAVSSRTGEGVDTAAEAARETSSSVNGISSAAEQLGASINEITRHVSHATGITGRAVAETQRTDTTVRGLAEAAGRIGEVVKLINDIAGRTNLLALNATIEAARAGDAGKGFAVVASEVKSLANQTARATEDIARQIAEVQTVTGETVQAIQRIAATIDDVNEAAMAIASGVDQQGDATREIARNVQQAAQRTGDLSSVMTRVSEDARVTGSTARDVKNASAAVDSEAETLRVQVDTFLTAIRAA